MCGRYVAVTSTEDLLIELDVPQASGTGPPPSWNVAPTQPVRIVLEPGTPREVEAPAARAHRQLRTVRWGLVPHWAKDRRMASRMINARSETVAGKPAFKAAAARRRCLVPADGYYEWMTSAGGKIPYYLYGDDGAPLAMAGLYETWRDPTVDEAHPEHLLWTCTVITRPASDALGHIHDRSPVVVPADLRSDWLDCSDDDAHTAEALLSAIPPPRLQAREVGSAVGNVRNNTAALIEPVPPTR